MDAGTVTARVARRPHFATFPGDRNEATPLALLLLVVAGLLSLLTERRALSEDGKTLVYSGVFEDPVYLAKPVEW